MMSVEANLKVWACNRFSKLVEQWLLNLGKLARIHHFKDVFNFIEEHDFFGAIDLGPIPEQTKHDLTDD